MGILITDGARAVISYCATMWRENGSDTYWRCWRGSLMPPRHNISWSRSVWLLVDSNCIACFNKKYKTVETDRLVSSPLQASERASRQTNSMMMFNHFACFLVSSLSLLVCLDVIVDAVSSSAFVRILCLLWSCWCDVCPCFLPSSPICTVVSAFGCTEEVAGCLRWLVSSHSPSFLFVIAYPRLGNAGVVYPANKDCNSLGLKAYLHSPASAFVVLLPVAVVLIEWMRDKR